MSQTVRQTTITLSLIFLSIAFTQISCQSASVLKQPLIQAKAVLTISAPGYSRSYSEEELLSSAELKMITVEKDPAYNGKSTTYSAVPMSHLFKELNLNKGATLLFSCLDGFSAPIDARKVLNQNPDHAVAYLAIEPQKARWKKIKESSEATPGPFYLIWVNPEKSKISREEWPFQLAGFTIKPSIEEQFPHILPDPKLAEASKVKRGFQIFVKNCFTCHTMNGEGTSKMGPDLNIPFGPTEYLKAGFLKKQIRNPQSIKRWSESKMPGFSEESLSDEDIDLLIEYLRHMTTRKHST